MSQISFSLCKMGNNFMDAHSGEVMLVQNFSPISLKASFERKSSP